MKPMYSGSIPMADVSTVPSVRKRTTAAATVGLPSASLRSIKCVRTSECRAVTLASRLGALGVSAIGVRLR